MTQRTRAPRPGTFDLERSVARLLTFGIYASIAILALGVGALAAAGRSPLEAGLPAFDPARLPPDLVALRPEGFLWLGLVAVIATPAARVAASLIGYVREGDRPMAIVACCILAVIALGVVVGVALEG